MEREKNFESFDETAFELSSPIETERMLLRHLKKEEFEVFDRHFRADKNFTRLYTGRKNTREYRKMILLGLKTRPNDFVMENAETHLLMGYVGLCIGGRVGEIEYYVFKEYRRRGFCREAAIAVIAAAFEGKLKESYGYVPDARRRLSHPTDVDCVKTRVFKYNLASESLLRSLGFTCSGYEFASRRFPDDSLVTEKLFYLKNPKIV